MSNLSQLQTSNPVAYGHIVAEVNALDLSKDPEQFKRSMYALTRLYKESQNLGGSPAEAEAAKARIQAIVQQQLPWDQDTFNDFANLLNSGEEPDTATQRHVINSTKFIIGLVDPPAGVLLAGESLVFDLGIPFTNSLPLPPPPADVLQAVGNLAFKKIIDLDSTQPFLGETLSLPNMSQVMKVGPRADSETLRMALPDSAKAVCDANVSGNTTPSSSDQVKAIADALTLQAQNLQVRNDELRKILKTQQDENLRQREAAAKAAEYARESREISSAINISGFLIEKLFNDPKAARLVTGIASSIQSVANAVHAFTNSQMGTLATCNAVLIASTTVANLINPGPSFEELVLKGLGQISRQMADFQRDVDLRLSIIDQKQDAILKGLTTMYQLLAAGQREAIERIQTLQADLAAYITRTIVVDRQNKVIDFNTALSQLRSALQDRDRNFRTVYKDKMALIGEHASDVASSFNFVGTDYSTNTLTDPSTFASAIETTTKAELLVGLFYPMCVRLGIANSARHPPSFVEWSRGTSAYLEARLSAPDIHIAEFDNTLINLWNKGIEIRDAIVTVSSDSSLRKAAKEYLQRAVPQLASNQSNPKLKNRESVLPVRPDHILLGKIDSGSLDGDRRIIVNDTGETDNVEAPRFTLTDFMKQAAQEYLNSLIPGFSHDHYSTSETPKVTTTTRFGKVIQVTDLRTSGEFYRDGQLDFKVKGDPVKKCLATIPPLIELIFTSSADSTILDAPSRHFDFFQIKINYGPHAGKTFGGQKGLVMTRDANPDLNGTGYWWRWQTEPGAPFNSTTGLLNYCDNLVNNIYVPDQMRTKFSGWLSNKLNNTSVKQSLAEFYSQAAILRLFATITRLRKLRDNADPDVATDIRNIEGIFTSDDISSFAHKYLNQEPALASDTVWAEAISEGFARHLSDSGASYIDLAKGLSDVEGISIVDETLRALATYMTVHRVTLDRPI